MQFFTSSRLSYPRGHVTINLAPAGLRKEQFVNHILQKTENGKTQNYFYANDKPLGDSGALGGADFDYNYTPVSDQFPGNVPGNYVVSAGDTLRGIALAMFGDAQLWYLIADANGLKSDADLRVGLNLVMPNKVTNLRNAHDTFKPYDASKIIGKTEAEPIAPPAPSGCGSMIVSIVVIVVAVIVAWYVAPAIMGAAGTSAATAGASSAGVAAGAGAAGASMGTAATTSFIILPFAMMAGMIVWLTSSKFKKYL